MRYQVKTVPGEQAEQARALGLVKITIQSAADLFDLGVPLVAVGQHVNSYHFFGGWHLACPLDSPRYYREGVPFARFVNAWNAHAEPELGRVRFFVAQEYVA